MRLTSRSPTVVGRTAKRNARSTSLLVVLASREVIDVQGLSRRITKSVDDLARRIWGRGCYAVVLRQNSSHLSLLAARHAALLTFTHPLLVPER
jgi:hypothetical protein